MTRSALAAVLLLAGIVTHAAGAQAPLPRSAELPWVVRGISLADSQRVRIASLHAPYAQRLAGLPTTGAIDSAAYSRYLATSAEEYPLIRAALDVSQQLRFDVNVMRERSQMRRRAAGPSPDSAGTRKGVSKLFPRSGGNPSPR